MGPEPGVNQRNFPRLPLLSASVEQAALLTQAVILCTSILSALHFTSPLQGGGPAPEAWVRSTVHGRVSLPAERMTTLWTTDSTRKLLSGVQCAEPAEHLPGQQGLRTGF